MLIEDVNSILHSTQLLCCNTCYLSNTCCKGKPIWKQYNAINFFFKFWTFNPSSSFFFHLKKGDMYSPMDLHREHLRQWSKNFLKCWNFLILGISTVEPWFDLFLVMAQCRSRENISYIGGVKNWSERLYSENPEQGWFPRCLLILLQPLKMVSFVLHSMCVPTTNNYILKNTQNEFKKKKKNQCWYSIQSKSWYQPWIICEISFRILDLYSYMSAYK